MNFIFAAVCIAILAYVCYIILSSNQEEARIIVNPMFTCLFLGFCLGAISNSRFMVN